MNEKELRDLYFYAMIDVVGAAPASAMDRPLSPIMICFAELIVRECTSVVDNLEGSDYIPWVNAAIKKHFGVE